MRRQLLIIVFAGLSLLSPAPSIGSDSRISIAPSLPLERSFVPNEILIGLKPEVVQNLAGQRTSPGQIGIASLDQLNQKYAVQQISPVFTQIDLTDPIATKYGLAGVFKLTVPAGTDIFAMVREYQRDPAIAYAEPNLIYRIADFPNDTDFSKQWALHNTGQTGGTPDADIDAPEAWDIEKGKPDVLIAIIDTGVDYNHPELTGGRVRTDIDKDFIDNDDDAMDDHGHGTYVAGIVAANTNNNRGIAGICQGCQILPVKVLDSSGSGTAESVAQGIQYAAQVGARIINMSLGFTSNCGCSQTIARAINYAFERGSLLIAASGNDSDKTRLSYPAASPRVLSVGASDHYDQEAGFSNRSQELDILAPGKNVYSLDRGGGYRTASGTSAAAPHVSGVAGLVWSARPTLTNVQVWWILYQSADDLPGTTTLFEGSSSTTLEGLQPADLSHKVYLPFVSKMRTTFGRLNAYRALRISVAGQVSAPQDNCSSEPDCPPGCPAEIVVSGELTEPDDLRLLRAFRDKVLAQSPIGQRWLTLYQQHRLETALILAFDEKFRTQTRLALRQWLPLFQALTYPDSTPDQQAILTSEQAEVLENVITGLMDRGSSQLRSDLAEVQETLQVRRFIGWDVRDAWRELNAWR
ncbi:S8 family peptidase [Thermoflexus sp.]|uniref:S8 family peptidase n=1 Tax=Thermoflexus sp. TaxID=1969742 RepID=UPI0035E43388